MPGANPSYTITIAVDPAAAQQALAGIAAFKKGFADVSASANQGVISLQKVEAEMRKLREVGATLAIAGGSILAPLVAAANQYASTYKNLESTSNAFIQAQQRQAQATTELGRAAAQALIPSMNALADTMQKIADFANKNPAAVQAAVNIGTIVAGVGALAVAIGTVVATATRLADVIGSLGISKSIGNFVQNNGGAGQAAVAAGILGVGLPLAINATISAMNALGQATGNATLAHASLATALDNGKTLILAAIGALGTIFIDLGAIIQTMGVDIQQGIDSVTKSLSDFGSSVHDWMVNHGLMAPQTQNTSAGVFGSVTQLPGTTGAIGQSPGGYGIVSPIQNELRAREAADKKAQDAANALPPQARQPATIMRPGEMPSAKGNEDVSTAFKQAATAATGLANQYDKQRDAIAQQDIESKKQFGAWLANAAGLGGSGTAGANGNGANAPNAQFTQAYYQYLQQTTAMQKQNDNEKLNAQTAYSNESAARLTQHFNEWAQIETDRLNQISDAQLQFNRSQHQQLLDFNHQELMTAEQLQFDKQERLYEMQLQAIDLAAQGDVAGFISATRQNYYSQIEEQRQQNFAKQQRQENFDWQQQQSQVQYGQQIDDINRQAARQRTASQHNYDLETQAALTAYTNQQTALQTNFDQQKKIYDTNFAQIVANINENWLGVKSAMDGAIDSMAQDALTKNKAYWAQLYASTLPPGFVQQTTNQGDNSLWQHGIPGHATGLANVPYDGYIASLHKGERILTAQENRNYSYNNSRSVRVNYGDISIGAGNNISRSEVETMLDEHQNAILDAIRM